MLVSGRVYGIQLTKNRQESQQMDTKYLDVVGRGGGFFSKGERRSRSYSFHIWVVKLQFFYFHPENWGNDSQFDVHILQMDWFNHQLDMIFYDSV